MGDIKHFLNSGFVYFQVRIFVDPSPDAMWTRVTA